MPGCWRASTRYPVAMPSSYTPPDVIVTQNRVSNSAPRVTPPLPVVVVGPAYQIVTRQAAGQYTAGQDLSVGFPQLTPGAIVTPSTVAAVLDAVDANGIALGVFPLTQGTDYAIVTDVTSGNPTGLKLYGTFGLTFSLLSSRNNDLDTLNNDSAIGRAGPLSFTDTHVDFLNLKNFKNDGTEFLSVSSPATQVGFYRINGVSQVLGVANTLSIEAVTFAGSAMVPVLDQYAATTGLAIPAGGSGRIKGAPTSHQYAAGGPVVANTVTAQTRGNSTSIVPATDTFGLGIKSIVLALGNAGADALVGASIPADGTGAAVWVQPTATTDPNWLTLVSTAKVGNWLRLKFAAAPFLRDYLVIAIDTVNKRLQIQDPFAPTGTATTTLIVDVTILSDGWLFEVFRGTADGLNVAGDVVYNAALGATIEIVSASPIHIDLAAPFPAAASGTVWQTKRGMALKNTDTSYDVRKNLTSGFSGSLLASYTALRTDLGNALIDVSSNEEINEKIGIVDPSNPLAFGLSLALGAAGSAGLVMYGVASAGSGSAEYSAALSLMSGREDLYYLVPMSEDPAIIALFQAHADTMSKPENKGERRVFGSSILPTFDAVWPLLTTGQALSVSVTTNGSEGRTKITELAPGAPVINWALLAPGQLVWLTTTATGAKTSAYRIKQVNIAQQYALLFTAIPGATASEYVRIETAPRTKQQQAEAWRDEASGHSDARLCLVRPDRFVATYTDRTGPTPTANTRAIVPMYFGCAAIAGFRASLPPQQPITNIGIPGIGELLHSNSYFSPDQLNTIAEGGNLIMIQRLSTSPVTIRHQLTTDMSAIETRELSIGILVDYAAKVYRTGLRPYIGKHNITAEFLTQLRGIGEALTKALVDAGVLRRGSRLVSLTQNVDRPDEVDMEVSLIVPYPCNRINVKLTF